MRKIRLNDDLALKILGAEDTMPRDSVFLMPYSRHPSDIIEIGPALNISYCCIIPTYRFCLQGLIVTEINMRSKPLRDMMSCTTGEVERIAEDYLRNFKSPAGSNVPVVVVSNPHLLHLEDISYPIFDAFKIEYLRANHSTMEEVTKEAHKLAERSYSLGRLSGIIKRTFNQNITIEYQENNRFEIFNGHNENKTNKQGRATLLDVHLFQE